MQETGPLIPSPQIEHKGVFIFQPDPLVVALNQQPHELSYYPLVAYHERVSGLLETLPEVLKSHPEGILDGFSDYLKNYYMSHFPNDCVRDAIKGNIDTIRNFITFGDPDTDALTPRALGVIANYAEVMSRGPERTKLTRSLEKYIKPAQASLSATTEFFFGNHTGYVDFLAYMASAKNVRALEAQRFLLTEATQETRLGYWILNDLLKARTNYFTEETFDIVREKFGAFGLDFDELYKTWNSHQLYTTMPELVARNYGEIHALEDSSKGASGKLFIENGIHNFYRYPAHVLSQNAEQDWNEKPFGLAVFPRADWNNAFSYNFREFDNITRSLEGKFGLMVVECGNIDELEQQIVRIDRKYGTAHKLAFLILAGHGSPEGVRLSDSSQKGLLTIEDMEKSLFSRMQDYFVEKPYIVLESCSTGTEKGFGSKLHQLTGATVIAPNQIHQ